MGCVTIAELRAGGEVDGVFACTRKDRLTARNGTPYLAVELRDRTRRHSRARVPRRRLPREPVRARRPGVGGRPRGALPRRAAGGAARDQDGRGGPRRVPAGGLPRRRGARRVPRAPRARGLRPGPRPAARARSSATRASAPSSGARRARAAGHHAYLGGLLEHTVAVATLAQEAGVLHPRLNSDLLLCAAILHDVGKTREFELGAEIELSEAGALVGHVALGQQLVAERARTLDGFPDAKLHALSHCILAHHGAGGAAGAALPLGRGAGAVPAQRAGRRGQGRARARASSTRAPGRGQTHVLDGLLQGSCRHRFRPIAASGAKKSTTLEAVAPPEAVEELLRQLVDARFVLTDRSGCITRWSRPAEVVFGWPASAMVGRGLLETLAIPGSIPPSGGHLEAAARRKDGSEVQVDLTLVPVQMAHSLEFNGFLEALEIVGPRVAGLERLQESHRTVVDWIAAAIAGHAEAPRGPARRARSSPSAASARPCCSPLPRQEEETRRGARARRRRGGAGQRGPRARRRRAGRCARRGGGRGRADRRARERERPARLGAGRHARRARADAGPPGGAARRAEGVALGARGARPQQPPGAREQARGDARGALAARRPPRRGPRGGAAGRAREPPRRASRASRSCWPSATDGARARRDARADRRARRAAGRARPGGAALAELEQTAGQGHRRWRRRWPTTTVSSDCAPSCATTPRCALERALPRTRASSELRSSSGLADEPAARGVWPRRGRWRARERRGGSGRAARGATPRARTGCAELEERQSSESRESRDGSSGSAPSSRGCARRSSGCARRRRRQPRPADGGPRRQPLELAVLVERRPADCVDAAAGHSAAGRRGRRGRARRSRAAGCRRGVPVGRACAELSDDVKERVSSTGDAVATAHQAASAAVEHAGKSAAAEAAARATRTA